MTKLSNYYQVTDFTGVNQLADAFSIDDSEVVQALNMDIYPGYIETCPGYDLFNTDIINGSGGIKHMLAYYKQDGTKQLIFANADKWWYLEDDALETTSWSTIGDYGIEVDNPRAIVYNDYVVMGSNNSSNSLKKWDGVTFGDVSTPPTHKVNIFEHFSAPGTTDFIIAAEEGQSTLWYSDVANHDSWTPASQYLVFAPNDGSQIRGLKTRPHEALVYKDNRKFRFGVELVGSNWEKSQLGGSEGSGGTRAHDSLVVVDESVFSLGDQRSGVQALGNRRNYEGDNIPITISEKIQPLISSINWNQVHKARAIYWDRKYMLAVPVNGALFNNRVFVWHKDQNGWTEYEWTIEAFCIFKDSDGLDQLYMGDSMSPRIYKYNKNTFANAGSGYRRTLLTKKYDFGDRIGIKPVKWIDIAGSMSGATEMTINVYVDGIKSDDFSLTSDQLLTEPKGGLIGDHILGSEFIGGNKSTDTSYRFIAHIEIGNIQRLGHSVQLKFSNNGAGEYWKLDYLGFDFLKTRPGQMPRRSKHILS